MIHNSERKKTKPWIILAMERAERTFYYMQICTVQGNMKRIGEPVENITKKLKLYKKESKGN